MSSYSIREVSLASKLNKIKNDIIGMKSTQLTGRANTVTKTVSTQPIRSVPSPTGTWQDNNFNVTFTAESQLNPYARIGLVYFDSSLNEITDNSKILGYYDELVVRKDDGKYRWIVVGGTLTGDVAPFYVQIIVSATDDGTIAFERIA